ncbi:uncharacterized protein LOC143254263 [Tachypleus tridentatus]|uniref:uncharacterized protein LOC143254263 n=1 Tax=Tachypleus tridentatus TaxID=6853 RepID=UPI003FD23762
MKRQPETEEELCLRYNLVLPEFYAYETHVKGESSIITGPTFSNGEVGGGGQKSMTFTSSEANQLTADDSQQSPPNSQSRQKGNSCGLGLAPLKVTAAANRLPGDILALAKRESGLSQESDKEEREIGSPRSNHVDENVRVSQAELVVGAHEKCDRFQVNYVESDINVSQNKKVYKYSNDNIEETAERTKANQNVIATNTNVQELHAIIIENDVQLLSSHVSSKCAEATPSDNENVGMASPRNEEEGLGQLDTTGSADLQMNSEEKTSADKVECESHKASVASDLERRNERKCEGYNHNYIQSLKPFKSSLKRSYTRSKSRTLRVTFSETMTVFSEEFSRPLVVAVRPTDLTLSEVCSMYEPPPQYQDLLDLNPPNEYQDTTDDVTFPLEREFGTVTIETATEEGVITEVADDIYEVKVRLNKGNTTVDTCVAANKLSSVDKDKSVYVEIEPLCIIKPGEDTQRGLECETYHGEVKGTCGYWNSSKNTAVLTLDNESSGDGISVSLDTTTGECVPDVLSGAMELDAKIPTLEKQSSSLSPPLKQFSVDLEYSGKEDEDLKVELIPRNSVHEADSDSSTSSQETIIMMTSEERKRNEEHILESLRRYEKLRRRILETT